MLPIPLSPQPLKIPLFTVFSSIFPCANAGSQLQHIYKKSFQNIFFGQCFSNVSSQTDGNLHVFCNKGSKSFQNIAFDSVFVMFPVKHTVIYTFFAITSVQNTCFCSVFNALASKNPAKSCYVQCFFHFWPFFHCRKATKMTQNSISIPSCAQTPKNPRKMSKTPPYSGLGAKPFLAPPAKADIATAILTNVIEHLVLLLPPNKHAFTAKAVWADLTSFGFGTLGFPSSSVGAEYGYWIGWGIWPLLILCAWFSGDFIEIDSSFWLCWRLCDAEQNFLLSIVFQAAGTLF